MHFSRFRSFFFFFFVSTQRNNCSFVSVGKVPTELFLWIPGINKTRKTRGRQQNAEPVCVFIFGSLFGCFGGDEEQPEDRTRTGRHHVLSDPQLEFTGSAVFFFLSAWVPTRNEAQNRTLLGDYRMNEPLIWFAHGWFCGLHLFTSSRRGF